MTYEVEYWSPDVVKPCPDGGKPSVFLWRDVFEDGEQCASIWIALTDGKGGPPVACVLLVDDLDSKAFGIRLVVAKPNVIELSFDHQVGYGQPCLTIDEALNDPRRETVTAILDAVVANDAELWRWFQRPDYDAQERCLTPRGRT